MKLLVLTNMFPSKSNQKGIFVKELVDCFRIDERISYVTVFNIDDAHKGFKKYIFSIRSVFKVLTAKKVDVINVHFGLSFIPLFFLLPYLWFNKIKVVITFHGSDLMGSRFVNFISNLSALFSDKVIVVSKCMVNYIWSSNKENVLVVPCGVNSIFRYVYRPDWDRSKTLKIIFPSTPSRPEKNYHLFRKVMCELKLNNISIDEICFDGLDRNQIVNFLSCSNLIFLSSLREGSPQVIKEALLTGLPIISTDVGDVVEILDGIPTDKVFISSNSDEIVEWILTQFSGGSIEKMLVDDKYKKYSNKYLPKSVVDILVDCKNGKK